MTKMETFLFFHLILLIFLTETVKSEVFTAIADLEEVVHTESSLIHTLENYIRDEEAKLNRLKRYAHIYKTRYEKAAEDVQLYVANPINAFTLVKRLTTDWRKVENLITTDLSLHYVENITYIKENMKFPTDEDLNGAAVALTRLQDLYLLDTSSLARGVLNGVKYSSEFSAADCFEVGRQCYNNGDYYHTQLWMLEADSRLNREVDETVERSDILEYLALSAYQQGNMSLGLDLTNKLLEILPTHPGALGNKVYYENELQKFLAEKKKDNHGSEAIKKDETKPSHNPYELEFCEPLCRGEIALSHAKTSKLKCRYLNRNHLFLLIAPFKVEEAHHKPDIFIFHDVLADSEIATIKRLALPRFERARVFEFNKTRISESRISKSAWLEYHEHKHVADITQRVSDMTGLTMETAEKLQVVNYGIGGYYLPHFDFHPKESKKLLNSQVEIDDRIGTVLFYMSDVQQGGATIFPLINVTLRPQKGAAAFWHNLHPSGDGDKMTGHAACPVMIGSKWVSNIWIHERGQEFLRPCTLERPREDLIV